MPEQDTYARQRAYNHRLRLKSSWFDHLNARRQQRIRHQFRHLPQPIAPEQRALLPFLLSHPAVDDLVVLEPHMDGWLAFGTHDEACVVFAALRTFSSAPACVQYVTSAGSGAVTDDEPKLDTVLSDFDELKGAGLWVTE